jgi:hypothetical protein
VRPQGFFRRAADDLAGVFKSAADVIDFTIDWSEHLQTGVTITSATWSVGGLTGSNEGTTASSATKRVGGGTAGADYPVTCTIVKSNGETVARTFVVSVVASLS